jgi:hypothetical protein
MHPQAGGTRWPVVAEHARYSSRRRRQLPANSAVLAPRICDDDSAKTRSPLQQTSYAPPWCRSSAGDGRNPCLTWRWERTCHSSSQRPSMWRQQHRTWRTSVRRSTRQLGGVGRNDEHPGGRHRRGIHGRRVAVQRAFAGLPGAQRSGRVVPSRVRPAPQCRFGAVRPRRGRQRQPSGCDRSGVTQPDQRAQPGADRTSAPRQRLQRGAEHRA